ncbi:RagB/SusD family nutrient uptake outer membrane protein [uncultured Chryseobacterium sp.]|uniref:RagB/SusD family nutrient uptake outer membrane protein n=1 Tax=uncultured Chryseobacterium sp. TaxID=259322 RepID=UPI0025F77A07|nr:RagB/SusD family nutrient uptake outer membrane protein [uncultured Chryseobacterium sp.]
MKISTIYFLIITTAVSCISLNAQSQQEYAVNLVGACYQQSRAFDAHSFSWIGLTSIVSDEADKGSAASDSGGDKISLDNLSFNAGLESLAEVWKGQYNGVYSCNRALYYLPGMGSNATYGNRLNGEAYFLRAYYYFNLVRLFGGVPIPYFSPDDTFDSRTSRYIRKTKSEVYTQIENDLIQAISLLPPKSTYGTADQWRASKGSALALMAKVKLYLGQWSSVVTYTDQITGYALTSNYQDNFKVTGENNTESIFEIQGTYDAVNNYNGIQGYSVIQGGRGNEGWGWGFNSPSATLQNAYEAGDVRKNATIITAGNTLWDGRYIPSGLTNPRYNYKAYPGLHADAWETDSNIKVLRYAEVLLMKAEALNELGQSSTALVYINQIRMRAGLAPVSVSGYTAVRDAIRKERRLELAMEHDRWFDIIRTGQAASAMTADGKTFLSYYTVFPIPQQVINEGNGLTVQNPGY